MSKHLPRSVRVPIESDNPSILRVEEKCVKCGMCKDACTQKMGGTGHLLSGPDVGQRHLHLLRTVRQRLPHR